jgi:hypothetical protein
MAVSWPHTASLLEDAIRHQEPRRARDPGSEEVGAGGGDAPPAPQASSEVPMHSQSPRRAPSAATLLWSAQVAPIHQVAAFLAQEVRA